MTDEMPKKFEHKDAERKIWELWERLDIFSAQVDPKKPAFCVVIPPPNVTGILHMGHVLDNVPQDIMTRWHRMRGFSALWIPGTDHAGIATQSVVKRELDKQGIQIKEIGREAFIAKVWEWKERHGQLIINQLKRLGCSCDWKRERFTMDEGLARAVLEAFVRYYERGLIYRGTRMINWCTVCETALADDEVEHANHRSKLWYIKYPVAGAPGEFVSVATTRPETMLGDTGVAVHPDDSRYANLVGKKLLLPLTNREITLVADSFVDPKFGTGAVKLTPAHDPNDYQAGQRLGLPMISVLTRDGRISAECGSSYAGLSRQDARKKIVAELEQLELLEKEEDHSHAVGECYRCRSIVEPMVSEQWFVKMKPLAEKAKQAVNSGSISIIPASERHDYFHWMDNIQDWCISRQLWWGHRIPVYYCQDCKELTVQVDAPKGCTKCSSSNLVQDADVLDTWFSSQLWPYSTLGWPDNTPELKYWYPNTWLMSGRDILFFWDARMIMSGLELLGEVPFKTLVLHGIARDSQGRKLSKSLGNSPDPIGLFDQYGTDAVRAGVINRYPMGRQDTRLADEIFREGQALVIKLWNASRLLISNLGDGKISFDSRQLALDQVEDAWIISRLSRVVEEHDRYLSKSDFVHAFQTLTGFFWNEFCDWYLEIIKPRLWDQEQREGALSVALFVARTLYKLFHPYIPFVTEELWQQLSTKVEDRAEGALSVAISSWPKPEEFKRAEGAEAQIELVISLVRGTREIRHDLNIAPKAELTVQVVAFPGSDIAARIGALNLVPISGVNAGYLPCPFGAGVALIELPSDANQSEMTKRLTTQISKLESSLNGLRRNLENADFVKRAPPEVVVENRSKATELERSIEKLTEFVRILG